MPRSSYYQSTNHLSESTSRLMHNASGKGKVGSQTTSYLELQDTSGRGRTQVWEMVTLPEAVVVSPQTGDRFEVAPFEYAAPPTKVRHEGGSKPPRRPKRDINPMLMHYVRSFL